MTSYQYTPSRRLRRAGIAVLLWALAFTTVYPFVFVFMTAIRTNADYNASPSGILRHFTWSNISTAWHAEGLSKYVVNTAIVVIIAVAILAVIALLGGFALGCLRVPFAKPLLGLSIVCMIMPSSVLMIPIFKVVLDFGLLNQRIGLILVYAGLNLPFSVFLMTTFVRRLPRELFEAARVDGAGPLRSLVYVAVPLVRPAIATLATLNFLILWNEFLFSLIILQSSEQRTLSVGLAISAGAYTTSVPAVAGGLVFSIIPPLLVFALFQRDLARGLTAGAVK